MCVLSNRGERTDPCNGTTNPLCPIKASTSIMKCVARVAAKKAKCRAQIFVLGSYFICTTDFFIFRLSRAGIFAASIALNRV